MDKQAADTFFKQVHELWIEPEMTRRTAEGTLPVDFRIYRARIMLPRELPPIVHFNNEIGWLAAVKLSPAVLPTLKRGDAIFWDQMQQIDSVQPPEVNGQRVAFIYLFKVARGFNFIFDFSPNISEELLPVEQRAPWDETFGPAIARTLQTQLLEEIVNIDETMMGQLKRVGLWSAPALVPYPLGQIVRSLAEGKPDAARSLLVAHCSGEFLHDLSSKWWAVQEFAVRRLVLQDALMAHAEKRFGLSIHALLPQLEGIITEWILTKIPEHEMPYRQESKTKKFRDLLLDGPPNGFTHRKIVESSIDFILQGPVLATFRKWFDNIDMAFPNRNVIGHGRYEDAIYTEENSIKLILLLDTVYYVISPTVLSAPATDTSTPPPCAESPGGATHHEQRGRLEGG